MKHYKDAQDNLFGYEEGDDVPAGLMEITMDEVRAIVAVKQQAEFDALSYAEKRAAAYPSIADQLDTIYHEGIDAWKAEIAAVKTEYPKP
jgi:response regulator of citrate/malate metabolism